MSRVPVRLPRWSRSAGIAALSVMVVACAEAPATTVVRGADDVQVMDPSEVAERRRDLVITTVAPGGPAGEAAAGAPPADGAAGDTIPLNEDDRPPEVRLFEAFGNFRDCLSDKGYGIEGDLTNPNNPAYQDSAYREAVTTCAARSDIVAVLEEVRATRENLTPEQVEQRNEVFIVLRECLEDKGWTVETATSPIGLLEPTEFHNAEGVLDERDINQCLSEQNLDG